MGAHRRAFGPRCALAAAAVHFLLHVRIHLRKIDVADALFAHGGLSSIVTSCFNPNLSRFGTETQHSKRARTTHANALHLKHEPMRAIPPARESSTSRGLDGKKLHCWDPNGGFDRFQRPLRSTPAVSVGVDSGIRRWGWNSAPTLSTEL